MNEDEPQPSKTKMKVDIPPDEIRAIVIEMRNLLKQKPMLKMGLDVVINQLDNLPEAAKDYKLGDLVIILKIGKQKGWWKV